MRLNLIPLFCSLGLCGCYTSTIAPDTAESANQHLANLESKPRDERGATSDIVRRLGQLFGDNPSYLAAIARDDSKSQLPRVRTMVPPEYPVLQAMANNRATVKIAFAVDEQGRVHDPRVFESPDSRFDQSAIDAVKKWSFFPGTASGVPAVFIMVIPIQFDGVKK